MLHKTKSIKLVSLVALGVSLTSCGVESQEQGALKNLSGNSIEDHAHGVGCFASEEIGPIEAVPRPQGLARERLQLVDFNAKPEAAVYLCPSSFSYDPRVRFCVKDSKALGPFPPRLVELCKERSGGAACDGNLINANYAASLRGTGLCPVGTSLRPSGYCAAGRFAYGPFTKDQVEACRKASGGLACESQRWSLSFAESLGVPGQFPQPLRGLKIAIDSGHGGNPTGWEPGAASPFYNEVTDYLLNIDTTFEIKSYLEEKGADVSLFQYPNAFVGPDLEGRGAKATGHNIFVSIHYNRYDSVVQGSEVFTHVSLGSQSDARLAYAIQDSLVYSLWNGGELFDRGVKSANFGVLRGAAPVVEAAVLVEGFFLDHNEGVVKIQSRRRLSARAIAEGIAKYWLSR